jgi:hypothetical protein
VDADGLEAGFGVGIGEDGVGSSGLVGVVQAALEEENVLAVAARWMSWRVGRSIFQVSKRETAGELTSSLFLLPFTR